MSDVMSVQQKEGKLREKPSFLGKILKSVPYGTKVEVVSRSNGWFQVKVDHLTGFIHETTLTVKDIALKSTEGSANSGVNDNEIVLAGKGFSSQVEKNHRQNNPELNYGLVDQMEKFSVGSETLEIFIKEGGLKYV